MRSKGEGTYKWFSPRAKAVWVTGQAGLTSTGNGGNLSKLGNSPVRECPAAGEWSPTDFYEVNG